jgi:hypothetical protein
VICWLASSNACFILHLSRSVLRRTRASISSPSHNSWKTSSESSCIMSSFMSLLQMKLANNNVWFQITSSDLPTLNFG